MKQLLNWAISLFTYSNTSMLESYIIKQNPTSIADVEFWTREFSQQKNTL
jgi:hypothetical protein